MRRTWIDKGGGDTVALRWQCALAGVSRSAVYAGKKPKPIALEDEVLKRLIDEEYTRHPFYGSRKMVVYLGRCGHCVNRKRAQRLMRSLGRRGRHRALTPAGRTRSTRVVPVPAARRGRCQTQPSLEHRNSLYASDKNERVYCLGWWGSHNESRLRCLSR